MASGFHTFITCDVFTAEKFQGNPLAIVCVRGDAIPQKRKSLIAREFGYSETVFIHDAPAPNAPRRVDIFTETGEEIPFAGHPIIGVAHLIFMFMERLEYTGPQDRELRQRCVLQTKAGPIPIFFNPYRQVAACVVPHNYHEHSKRVSLKDVLAVQPQTQIIPTISVLKEKTHPVVSIVKGMTFSLIDLTSAPEVLAGLKTANAPAVELDADWSPSFVGSMYYVSKGMSPGKEKDEPSIHSCQVRMITQGIEDPGTGSACSALACYLALSSKPVKPAVKGEEVDLVAMTAAVKLNEKGETKDDLEHHVFAIEQGIEMGRKCTIAVEVDIKVDETGARKVANVVLSGRCTFVTEGRLMGR